MDSHRPVESTNDCRVRKGAGSQSVVSVWQHTLGGSSSGSVALQSCEADVLFILGMQYLYLGVHWYAFRVRYAVGVLVMT